MLTLAQLLLILVAVLPAPAGWIIRVDGVDDDPRDILRRAHAHNDYEHSRPLLDALDRGFLSVEADVHLIEDSLFVAHDRDEIRPGRTLETLYLEPLRRRVIENEGAVYPDGPPLQLLVDVKSEAESTYRALRRVLASYADILTKFADGAVEEGAVMVVVSGNRARRTMQEEGVRFAAYDGRLEDLEKSADAPPTFIPLISINWATISSWNGEGAMPDATRALLREIVAETHQQGRALRFWGTRDAETVWRVLHEEAVDFIGTDDLDALRRFLLRAEGGPTN